MIFNNREIFLQMCYSFFAVFVFRPHLPLKQFWEPTSKNSHNENPRLEVGRACTVNCRYTDQSVVRVVAYTRLSSVWQYVRTYVWQTPGSHFGRDIGYSDKLFVFFFLSPCISSGTTLPSTLCSLINWQSLKINHKVANSRTARDVLSYLISAT